MTSEFEKIVNKDCRFFKNQLDKKLNKYILSGENQNEVYRELIAEPYSLNNKQLRQLNSSNLKQKNKILKKYENAKKNNLKEIDDVNFKVKKFLKNNINTIKK